MRRTIWLASYPKSGNTWFRMLLANLRHDAPVDINDPRLRGGIASARRWFDETMLFPSGLLTHQECDRLRPEIYTWLARDIDAWPDEDEDEDGERAAAHDDTHFIKTHDAWTLTSDGMPLLGGRGAAEAAILIVRDPRDVVGSLANHNRRTIDETIGFMADPTASFCGAEGRQHNQLRQQLPSWSGFNASWQDQQEVRVHLVRYEDLRADTATVLAAALAFAGVMATDAEIERAVVFADFANLKAQEEKHGFREAPRNMTSGRFFRRGVSGNWRDELSSAQVARIEADHEEMMTRLSYPCARSCPRTAAGAI